VALSDTMRDFWVVAGTAAPIIALANQVAVIDAVVTLGGFRRAARDDSRSAEARNLARIATGANHLLYYLSMGNLLAQGTALALALISLLRAASLVAPLEVGLLLLGLAATGVGALLSGLMKYARTAPEMQPLAVSEPPAVARPARLPRSRVIAAVPARSRRPRWQRQ
jgi:hypothetical protein